MVKQIAREKYMPIAIEQTLQAWQIMVPSVPVGTNLALLHLIRVHFPKVALNHRQIRKKNSVTAHLPKGIAAHRRQKQPELVPQLAAWVN